ncbi:hypothetical protein E8L99_22270 [Phreatobacter aquaticus]|uniref:Uncharacterized protein n=1 Tax=Phreatobacter aquaticus TaxID=2570229 RepID=A0A4D7QKS2_9HYPH|nr:hypothetical protein [Phreatobacter aquaticus]QCK88290.1 hypothetical protein E8L99_22270 [Phreatobacter aquaticus]
MRRLIVTFCAIYLAAVALASATTGWGLIEAVPGYRLSILWMSPETLAARLDAFVGAGRIFEAEVYAGAHAVSWAIMLTLVLVGTIRPFLGPSEPIANMRSSAVVLGGLAGLVLLAHWSRPLLDEASRIPSASTTLSSMPAYWLVGMAVSAAITGAHLSMLAHDAVLWARARYSGPQASAA